MYIQVNLSSSLNLQVLTVLCRLLRLLLFQHMLSLYIVILQILTKMDKKTFFQQYGKRIILLFFLIAIVVGLLRLTNDLKGRSLILGNPDNIVVISPNESQDVVIIGDPQQVKVKPKQK